jgi:hypothetical protein
MVNIIFLGVAQIMLLINIYHKWSRHFIMNLSLKQLSNSTRIQLIRILIQLGHIWTIP